MIPESATAFDIDCAELKRQSSERQQRARRVELITAALYAAGAAALVWFGALVARAG